MTIRTVQDMIDALSRVEDKTRTVCIAGGGRHIEALGLHGAGQVIFWDKEKYENGGRQAIDEAFRRYCEVARRTSGEDQ